MALGVGVGGVAKRKLTPDLQTGVYRSVCATSTSEREQVGNCSIPIVEVEVTTFFVRSTSVIQRLANQSSRT